MIEVNHIDCFSGPGGICTGFKAAGINTIAAIEKVESCVMTYAANHSSVNIIHKDIRNVTEEDVLKAIGNKKIHIVTSGMPCETFSTAGSKSRSSYDYRQQLYSEAIRIARIVNSPLIMFENVPGILTKKVAKDSSRYIIDDIIQELEDNNYKNIIKVVLKAVNFGIPQNRERFFILASNNLDYKLAPPKETTTKPTTVEEALKGLPLMEANDTTDYKDYESADSSYSSLLKNCEFWKLDSKHNHITYHKAPNHREKTIERFKLIEPNEGLADLFSKYDLDVIRKLQSDKVLPKKAYIQRNKRLKLNEPSKTVTSHCLDELLHPKLNRALTIRECARLQSFPDNYIFEGPDVIPHNSPIQDKYEQIGDAVPPLLAYNWGKKIMEILKEQ